MTEQSPVDASKAASAPVPPTPAAGWYADPTTGQQRWWDGAAWASPAPPPPPQPQYVPVPQPLYGPQPPVEKSSGVASVLTFFFPGAGHLYLGDNQKAMPGLIVNTIGVVCALTLILLPITLIGWVITLLMTLPNIKRDTERANAEAAAEYARRHPS